MAYKLRFTPEALSELDEILAHIAEKSPQGSLSVQACLRDSIDMLAYFPYIGGSTGAGVPPMRRSLAAPYPYAIFYQIGGEDVLIIGIRHTSRNPASMPGH